MNTFIVVPAYNEASMIQGVLRQLKKAGFKNILVVDDGSSDATALLVETEGVFLVRHLINRGLGATLATGIQAALSLGADILVTFDADGQHAVTDVTKMIKPLFSGNFDIVIGSRLLNSQGMPFVRRCFNRFANLITLILFGVWVTDSQSGLRAFTRKTAEQMELQTNRMEVSSEFIREIARKNLRLKEIPVQAIYTDYSLSKGQSFKVGVKTLCRLLIYKLSH